MKSSRNITYRKHAGAIKLKMFSWIKLGGKFMNKSCEQKLFLQKLVKKVFTIVVNKPIEQTLCTVVPKKPIHSFCHGV